MKAWLGNTVYDVTAEQLAELNRIAEEVYQKTGDRGKGFEAAVEYVKEQGCAVLKKVRVIAAEQGNLLAENPEKLQEMFDKMFAAALKKSATKKPAKKK